MISMFKPHIHKVSGWWRVDYFLSQYNCVTFEEALSLARRLMGYKP